MKTALTRRQVCEIFGKTTFGLCILPAFSVLKTTYSEEEMLKRPIPSSGELLPVVGLGTWQTFDVSRTASEQFTQLGEVLKLMKKNDGKLIDTSPMYKRSESNIGLLTKSLGIADDFFYATKVWTSGKNSGIHQMEQSFAKMNRPVMDLIQIHNLVDWKIHVNTLRDWKDKGKIRYWGITHYLNSSHATLQKIIRNEKPDFVQFNYSINSRNAENGLLQTASEKGTAVIINRPYSSGSLFRTVKNKQLPDWCEAHHIHSWGQFFLKYILANPAVTCVIPGTSKPHHLVDNMKAGYGEMPNLKMQKKMLNHFKTL